MTQSNVRYYLGRLKEQHGDDQYDHRVIFKTDDDPDAYLENVASTFYLSDSVEEADNGYYFCCGERHVRTVGYAEISEDFFNTCVKLDAIRQA